MKITPRVLDVDCMHHFSGPKGRKPPISSQSIKNRYVGEDPVYYGHHYGHERTVLRSPNGIRVYAKPLMRLGGDELSLENERSLPDKWNWGQVDYWNSVQQDRYVNQHQES